ncbi:MAG: hypothetical protein HC923_03715 [Myxococcales bacterium]|nr:hypothetical protein [Myxococcales bacterium]
MPFVHEDEATYFFMTMEAGTSRRSQLMLHILTPLTAGRRVETSTLTPLSAIPPPSTTDFRSVHDANTVEELWAHHRRALTAYERRERRGAHERDWLTAARECYESWVHAAVHARKLVLDRSMRRYRVL